MDLRKLDNVSEDYKILDGPPRIRQHDLAGDKAVPILETPLGALCIGGILPTRVFDVICC